MNNSRPDTFFSVSGTSVTLLTSADDSAIWVKTRHTMSMPLWEHQISMARHVGLATYHADGQHFRIQAPGAVWLARHLERRGQLPLSDPVPMALGLLNLLDQWHRWGIALLSLSPKHLLYRPESHEFWLTDWSTTLPYTDELFDVRSNHLTDDNTAYASPEQTGKTALPLDYRSDYFSLGVLLYQIATGQFPFEGLDSASVVYRILTYEPVLVRTLNPNLSAAFEAILTKLLAKNPNERYQSTNGLRHDLTQLTQPDFDPATFQPGQFDSQGAFLARSVLVGRQPILKAIDDLIHYVNDHQQKGLAVITGAPGSGKTALLNQLETGSFSRQFVLFSDLRDDQTQPYQTLRATFENVADGLLGQDLSTQNDFRFHLESLIGNVLGVLVDFCPSVQKLIDTPLPIQPTLSGNINQDRLAYVMAGFLRALVLTGRPVLWLLDNIHAASNATLRLFDSLVRESPLNRLTLVATANRDETDAEGLNSHMQAFIQRLNAPDDNVITVLPLADLTQTDLADWLLKLQIQPDSIPEAAALIQQKTGGNPFSVQRLLQEAVDQRAVEKVDGAYFFRLDTNAIRRFQTTDNLLHYLTDQIRQLLPDARHLFDQAVCFRQSFGADELSRLSGTTVDTLQPHLQTLLTAGILVPKNSQQDAPPTYQFANPHLADIGRQLLTPTDRQDAFTRVATYLHTHDDLTQTDNLFQLATKLLELSPDRSAPFTKHLLRAGQEAATIGATELSLRCYAYVTNQFTETDWQERFDTCFATYNQYLLAVAYAEGEQALFAQLGAFIRQKARHKEDMAAVTYNYGQGLIHHQRVDEAIRTTLPVLRQFGVDLPLDPSTLNIIYSSIKASLLLRNRTPEQIEQLPANTDPQVLLVIHMLQNVSLASALGRPKMIPVIMLHILRHSVQSGLTAESGAGFLMYAIVQASFQNNYRNGVSMMELALRLSRRFNATTVELSASMVKSIYIHHWVAPLHESLDLLLDTYRRSRENGLLTNAFNALGTASAMNFYAELPLEVVQQRSLDSLRLLNLQRQTLPGIFCRLSAQIAYELQQPQPPDSFFAGPHATLDQLEPYLREQNDLMGLMNVLTMRMFGEVHLHRFQMGLADFKTFRLHLRTLGEGLFIAPIGYFYGGLLSLQQPGPLTGEQKRFARVSIARLKAFSNVYEGNNRSRYFLLKSQYLFRTGNPAQALPLLDQAIETATQYGQPVEEALAYEIKGRYYLGSGQTSLGRREMREAIALYTTWGAQAIVSRLHSEFPILLATNASLNRTSPDEGSADAGALDLISFQKISALINGNLKLDNLLPNLLDILLENAGAHKAALLLHQQGELQVHALKEASKATSLDVRPLAQSNLPQNPIRYVSRTLKPLVLVQAYTDRIFSADTYFQRGRTLSVLVMPILKQDQLLAVIYLENSSTSGAFNSRQLKVLQLLASQIAISLENALLYDDMESRIQERTQQLRQEMDTSEALLLNILPKAVAQELKETGRAAARQFANVTVMFTDFVNFTQIAEQTDPDALVAELDFCFGEFDRITAEHGLEKIKTIGDAYLCAGGLSEGSPDHAADVVRAALDIQAFISHRKKQQTTEGGPCFDIRIGIHNGPIVAGVVGTRKFAYDIWGDTVNTAARMEQNSEPGRINVSSRTWHIVRDRFTGTFRGSINAKNKGNIDMYFVDGPIHPVTPSFA